jgi:hypothetical protein
MHGRCWFPPGGIWDSESTTRRLHIWVGRQTSSESPLEPPEQRHGIIRCGAATSAIGSCIMFSPPFFHLLWGLLSLYLWIWNLTSERTALSACRVQFLLVTFCFKWRYRGWWTTRILLLFDSSFGLGPLVYSTWKLLLMETLWKELLLRQILIALIQSSKYSIVGFLVEQSSFKKFRRAGGVAQMVEQLPSKCEVLSSNTSITRKKKI